MNIVPFWLRDDTHYSSVAAADFDCSSENVYLDVNTTVEQMTRLVEWTSKGNSAALRRVRIHCRLLSEPQMQLLRTLVQKQKENIFLLSISVFGDDGMVGFCEQLMRINEYSQLTNLQLHLRSKNGEALKKLLNSLNLAQFPALNAFSLSTNYENIHADAVDAFFSALERLLPALISFELFSDLTAVSHRLFALIGTHGSKLQHAAFCCPDQIDETNFELIFESALLKLPRLTSLQLDFGVGTPVDYFSRYFSSPASRFLKTLKVTLLHYGDDNMQQFFWLLEKSRIQSLEVSTFLSLYDPNLLNTRTVELGWLTHLKFLFRHEEQPLKRATTELLIRNKQRHASCRCICIALIALRKQKKCLVLLDVDIVRIISRDLWETRNLKDWDLEK